MQTVRRSELKNLFDRIQHAMLLSITARTIPDLRKTAEDGTVCPFWIEYKAGRLVKVAAVNGVVYWIYTNSVNRKREKQGLTGDFQAMPRKWGHRIPRSPFVEHTTKEGEHKLYVELKVERSLGYVYLLDGREIDQATVNKFCRPESDNRQGLAQEDAVRPRDYFLGNILEVRATFDHDQPGEIYSVIEG